MSSLRVTLTLVLACFPVLNLWAAPLRVKIESFSYSGPAQERWLVQSLRYYLFSELSRLSDVQALTVEQQDDAVRSLVEKQRAGESVDIELETAKILKADLRCAGSLELVGSGLRLRLRLLRAPDFSSAQATQIDGSRDDLSGFQGKLLDGVLLGLDLRLTQEQRKTVKAFVPKSQQAYEFYSKAATSHAEGDFAQGLIYVQKALASDPEYLHALNLSGILYLELGDFDRAIAIHETRKAILADRNLKNTPAYAATLHNLARARVVRASALKSEFDGPIALYKEANNILSRTGFFLSPDYAANLDGLGDIAQRRNDFKGAVEQFDAERALQEKLALSETVAFASTVADLAGAYAELKDYRKAEAFFDQAADLLRKKPQRREKEKLIHVLRHSARCFQADGKGAEAIARYEEANALRKEIKVDGDTSHAADLHQMANIHLVAEKPDKALACLAQEKAILEKNGIKTGHYAKYLATVGIANGQMKKYCEGAQFLRQAREIFAQLPDAVQDRERAARQLQLMTEQCKVEQ